MAVPTAPLSFLAAAAKSGLVSEDLLDSLSRSPIPPDDLAASLVASDVLSQFQADKLLAGLWQGLVLGPYRVLAPVGRGGMGVVYLASKGESNAGPRFALKILPPPVARAEPQRLERFRREIRLGTALPPHPAVAKTVEGGEINGVHFLAMEFVPGPTLRKRIHRRGPLTPERAATLAFDLAAGLGHLHTATLIHRDLKPANVILSPTGAKLLDLGFAVERGEPVSADPRVTGGNGYVLGTHDYIAPEQIRAGPAVTPASDFYALGGTLFFALTGTPPYPGGSSKQKLRWHQSSEPPDVRTINPAVPEGLATLVSELLRKDPAERPASAGTVRDRLLSLGFSPAHRPKVTDEVSVVRALTHRHVAADDVREPIVENETPGEVVTPAPPSLYWGFIASLVALILMMAVAMAALIAWK
jgi:serine/threonine protein kinase